MMNCVCINIVCVEQKIHNITQTVTNGNNQYTRPFKDDSKNSYNGFWSCSLWLSELFYRILLVFYNSIYRW